LLSFFSCEFRFHKDYSMLSLSGRDDGSDLRRGKVTALLLPQEDMLERFLSNVTEKHDSWRTTKKNWFGRVERISACSWLGFTCNEHQQVENIHFTRKRLKGSLQWEYLPPTILSCNVAEHDFTGSLSLHALPSRMIELKAKGNKFSGELCLTRLPDTLTYLNLAKNLCEGSVDVTQLPAGLISILLSQNNLSGNVDLSRLPQHLKTLILSDNEFTGPLDLQHLPLGIDWIRVSHNNFSGLLDLQHLPPALYFLDCDRNCFSGLVEFDNLPLKLARINLSCNKDLYGALPQSVLANRRRIHVGGTAILVVS